MIFSEVNFILGDVMESGFGREFEQRVLSIMDVGDV